MQRTPSRSAASCSVLSWVVEIELTVVGRTFGHDPNMVGLSVIVSVGARITQTPFLASRGEALLVRSQFKTGISSCLVSVGEHGRKRAPRSQQRLAAGSVPMRTYSPSCAGF